MQEKPKYVSQPLQSNHMLLVGDAWELGGWQKPSAQLRIVNNNVWFEVFLNDPSEGEKMLGSKPMRQVPLSFRTNYIDFLSAINRLEEMCTLTEPASEKMAAKGRVYNHETGTVSNDIKVTNILSYGINPEGLMFIGIKDAVHDRKEFKYQFGNREWHPVKTDSGELEKSEESKRACKAWIEIIKQTIFNSAYHRYIPEEVLRDERKRRKEEAERAKTEMRQTESDNLGF